MVLFRGAVGYCVSKGLVLQKGSYFILKFLNKYGMRIPVNKLDITTVIPNGIWTCANDRNSNKPITVPNTTCLIKFTGSRSNLPLRNNRVANHAISNIFPPLKF
jgi:hypothetical protein